MTTYFDDQFNTAGSTAFNARSPNTPYGSLNWSGTGTVTGGFVQRVAGGALGSYMVGSYGDGSTSYGLPNSFNVDFAWVSPLNADLTSGGSNLLVLQFVDSANTGWTLQLDSTPGHPELTISNASGTVLLGPIDISAYVAPSTSYVGHLSLINGNQVLTMFGQTFATSAAMFSGSGGLSLIGFQLDRNAKIDYITVSSYTAPTGSPPAANTASFTAAPVTGVAPFLVSFNDTSVAGTSSPGATHTTSWTFGDGGTATTPGVNYPYAAPGIYTVTMTATWSAGLSPTTVTQTNLITVTSPAAPLGPFWQDFISCHEVVS